MQTLTLPTWLLSGVLLGVPALARPAAADETPLRPSLTRFTIDSARSEVGFDGTSTLHDFTGRTREVSGTLLTDPDHPTVFAAGKVTCVASSLDTDNDSRDEKMREHLDVAHFPEITFALAGTKATRPDRNELEVAGTFAIHGVQREYVIALTAEPADGGALHVRGRLPLQLTDHGIVPPAVALIEVGDRVEVFFDLTLVRAVELDVAGTGHELTVRERLEPVGGVAVETDLAERYFEASSFALWERPSTGRWVTRGAAAAPVSVDVATGAALATPVTAEESFTEARDTMARLEDKLAKLDGAKRERAERAVAETLTRLRAALQHAPTGALERTKTADGEKWTLGGTVWLEFSGDRGAGSLVPLLATLDGLPTAVRDGLAAVQHVPERLVVRTATMGGVRTLELTVGPRRAAALPHSATELNAARMSATKPTSTEGTR
jgi:polyisoprenoid-binding protein YceI